MFDINRLQGKTVLLTGATGFIGKHLVHRLRIIPGLRLILLSRKPMREEHKEVVWVQSSLEQLSHATWREAGIEYIDFVFHLGAFIPKVQDDANNIKSIYSDNLLGTRFLLESLLPMLPKIIFASTLDVYAILEDGIPIDETSPIMPISLYGASKFFCEQLVQVYARRYRFPFAILRYGHIFGPGEEAYGKLIPHTIRRLLQGEAPILFGDGSEKRDFLYVSDAVEATLRAAVSELSDLGPINIVRGISYSAIKIVSILMSVSGCQGSICFKSSKPSGRSSHFDNRRMRELLGEWPLVSIENGLKREIDYVKGQRYE